MSHCSQICLSSMTSLPLPCTGLVGIDLLSISQMTTKKICSGSMKNVSEPFAQKMIHVGLLHQMVQFTNNHGLCPTCTSTAKSLAPNFCIGHDCLVEKKKDNETRHKFEAVCKHFSKASEISSDVRMSHARASHFSTDDTKASVTHWFLLHWSEHLLHAPPRQAEAEMGP